MVQDSKLTKNLSSSYRFVDYEREECKDFSFSATINAKSPLDEELTSVTITMKTGDTMEVPLYLSGSTECEDGTTDYVFTGMVTLEHPGMAPNYFDDERVPARLDLNYFSALDATAAGEYTGTQNRLTAMLEAAALTNRGVIAGYKAGTLPKEPADMTAEEISQQDGDVFLYKGQYYFNNKQEGILEKHCTALPNVWAGSENVTDDAHKKTYRYQNCMVASDGKHLAASSDCGTGSTLMLWKNIPVNLRLCRM